MTDKTDQCKPFDPSSHRFGMAYEDEQFGICYPIPCYKNTRITFDCLFLEGNLERDWIRCEHERFVRSPEHDLIPRTTVQEEKHRAYQAGYFDAKNGTPCEQIQHQQEMDKLKSVADKLAGALRNLINKADVPIELREAQEILNDYE